MTDEFKWVDDFNSGKLISHEPNKGYYIYRSGLRGRNFILKFKKEVIYDTNIKCITGTGIQDCKDKAQEHYKKTIDFKIPKPSSVSNVRNLELFPGGVYFLTESGFPSKFCAIYEGRHIAKNLRRGKCLQKIKEHFATIKMQEENL